MGVAHAVEIAADGFQLAGQVLVPPGDGPFAALVFLHGSGPARRESWADEAAGLAASDITTLAYDKPGCGGSDGDWTGQSFEDRARESLAALAFLRARPEVDASRAGLLGMSQGGWIGPLAAAMSDEVGFVVALSASGTGPRAQDLYRVERQLRTDGFSDAEVESALAAWRERDRGFQRQEPVEVLVAIEQAFSDQGWYQQVAFEDPAVLRFVQGIWGFDPLPYLVRCRCPILAVWGEEDVVVAAEESRAIFASALTEAGNEAFELIVLPALGHGLGAEDDGRMRPAVFRLIADWIGAVGSGRF